MTENASIARSLPCVQHPRLQEDETIAFIERRGKFGIGIDEAANGVFLPGAQHAALHTKEYYEAVNAALQGATTREQVLKTLETKRGYDFIAL